MINVIVPITKNVKSYYKILDRLTNLSSVNLIVGICRSEYEDFKLRYGDEENLSLHCYEDYAHREEIINSLQSYIVSGQLMVMRKPITMEEFNKFITQRKEVITCQRSLNQIKAFFFMIWQKILKLILGVRLYEGDPSVVYLSEDITSVLSQSGNLSYSTRVNRWKGVEQETVKVAGEKVKTSANKKQNLSLLITAIISILIGVTVTVLVCLFAKLSIIVGLLIACLDIIALSVCTIMFIMIAFNNIVGKKYFARAPEIELEDLEMEE